MAMNLFYNILEVSLRMLHFQKRRKAKEAKANIRMKFPWKYQKEVNAFFPIYKIPFWINSREEKT